MSGEEGAVVSKINLLAMCSMVISLLPACAAPPAVTSVPQLVALISPDNAGQVYEVAYSPDGRLLAVASSQGIYLYDTKTLAQLRFIESDHHVLSVAFSPDGQTLASGFFYHGSNPVRLWRVADGNPLSVLEGHKHNVKGVAFSPDGQTLASGGGYGDNTIRLWQVGDGVLLRTFVGHTKPVVGVLFSPDGQILGSAGWDRTARVWRVSYTPWRGTRTASAALPSPPMGKSWRRDRWTARCAYGEYPMGATCTPWRDIRSQS
jgi:WD40 repeat protein